MKITRLEVAGYRSLQSVTWEPGDLNIIIGPNASGKSNLLQLLRLVCASAQGSLSKFLLSQGGMGAVLFDGGSSEIRFELFGQNLDVQETSMATAYTVAFSPIVNTSSFQIGSETLLAWNSGKETIGDEFIYRNRMGASIQDVGTKLFEIPRGRLPEEETVLSTFGGTSPLHYQLIETFRPTVAAWLVLDGFHTDKEAPVRQAIVTRFDERLDADGQNLVAVLHTLYSGNREFKQAVDDAMTAAFDDEYEELTFTPAGEQRIQLAVRWSKLKRPQTAASLSDGTLRFLFLITALAQPNPPALIAIDEPETGLHPSMMRIIAEYAQEASRHTQVVLTTHSPALLDAFTDMQPTVTVCELKDGATVLKNLDGDTLKYWLSKYSLGELQQSGQLETMLPAPEAA